MKYKIFFWFVSGLLSLMSVLTLNDNPALAGYSRCRSNNNRDITRYCFRRGDSGPLIKTLVEELKTAGYYAGRTTNRFDSSVELSVKRFQRDYRSVKGSDGPVLSADGIVGSDTLIRLCQAIMRGCGPDADVGCYIGSPRGTSACLEKYR